MRSSRSLVLVGVAVAVLAFAGATRSADLSARYVWRPVRIGGGGWMRGMAIDPSHPQIRYARGDVDDLYRWDSARGVWIPTKIASAFPAAISSAPVQAGCGAIAIDPLNPKVVLCAYAFRRSTDIASQYPDIGLDIYRSDDGGRTFRPGNLSLSGNTVDETEGERLAIDPNDDRIVFFGSPQGGLFRSSDGGIDWTAVSVDRRGVPVVNAKLPRFDGGAGTVLVDGIRASGRVYLTTGSGGVMMSSNGGRTWTDIAARFGIDGHAGFATVDSTGRLWITEEGSSRLWCYSRAGAWTSATTPHGGILAVTVDPRRPSRLFAIASGGALSRSTDGGKTWTDLGDSMQFSATQPIQWLRPSHIRPQGHYVSLGGIYMGSNGELFVPSGNDGILACRPDDATNSAVSPPVWWSDSKGIEEMVSEGAVIPPGGRPVLAVEDETLFTIDDPDMYTARHFSVDLWRQNDGLSSAQDIAYCPTCPKYIVETSVNVSAGNPQALTSQFAGYSTDGGETWIRFGSILSGSQPSALYAGDIAVGASFLKDVGALSRHADIVWAPSTTTPARVPAPYYSNDGGREWTQTHSFDHATGASKERIDGHSVCMMGPQWGPWLYVLDQHNLVADPIRPDTFYMDMTAGGFWRSVDGGAKWTRTAGTAQLPAYAHHGKLVANPAAGGDLWFVDGYEGAKAHGLWHSTNGGDSFVRIPGWNNCWAIALGKAARLGGYPALYVYGRRVSDSRWGVFRSTDEGATWDRISFYPTGLLDVPACMSASWDKFGLVYIGFRGNSFVYGRPKSSQTRHRRP